MSGIVQKILNSGVSYYPGDKPGPDPGDVPMTEVIWLVIKYFLSTANLQKILFMLAFLTYGVGDGITAAYMMDKKGVMTESNPIVRFMYISSGTQGVVTMKVWFTFLILYFVWIISRRTNTYWTINGFLSALCIGGIMAIRANIMAANDMSPPSPESVVMTFLFLTLLFVMIGDQMDKIHGGTAVKRSRGRASHS